MRNGRTTYERGKQSAVRPAGFTHTTRKVTECAASVPDASLSGRSAAAEVAPRGLGRLSFGIGGETAIHGRACRCAVSGMLSLPGSIPVFLNFGLTPRHQPASDPLRQCPEWHEGSCLSHGSNHEAVHVQSAGIFFQQYGSPQGEHSN
jgi:hypothetical protein